MSVKFRWQNSIVESLRTISVLIFCISNVVVTDAHIPGCYWPGLWRSQQTSCSVWWTLLPASLTTLGSLMVACRGYYTTNSTGLVSPTEYNSSSPCRWIDVFMEQLCSTWWTVATQTADVVSRQHLRSASQRKLIVPRYRLDSYGRRCFAVKKRPVDLESATRQSSWLSSESQHFQSSSEYSLFAKFWPNVHVTRHETRTLEILADLTNGRAYATVLRLSVVVCL